MASYLKAKLHGGPVANNITVPMPKIDEVVSLLKYHAGRAPAGSQNPPLFQELSDNTHYVKGRNLDEFGAYQALHYR